MVRYSSDYNNIYQAFHIYIKAPLNKVFENISTTNGISKWFEELSYHESRRGKALHFNMGAHVEVMKVTSFQPPRKIAFDWASGTVTFTLVEAGNDTLVEFLEVLPKTFSNIAKDFTSWQFKIKSLAQVCECGEPLPLSMDEFNEKNNIVNAKIEQLLEE